MYNLVYFIDIGSDQKEGWEHSQDYFNDCDSGFGQSEVQSQNQNLGFTIVDFETESYVEYEC